MEQKSMEGTTYPHIENVFTRDPVTNKLTYEYKSLEFEYLQDCEWIATEKIDGTNIRIMWDGKELMFNGKTDSAQIPGDLCNKIRERFEDKEPLFIEKFGDKQVVIYAEGYGAGIQKGGKYRNDKDIVVYDIMINGTYLYRGSVQGICDMLGLDIVPIVKQGSLCEIIEIVRRGYNSTYGDFDAEGVVARPKVELVGKHGRVIVKIKTCDFCK